MSAVVRLQSVEVFHHLFPSTSHLLHPVRVPIQLPLDLVRTVPVRPKRVRRLSCLSKPFGVVVPGRLSFRPPRTPAPNLCAGAARTPLRFSLVPPSAFRTSGPLAARALC
ncbi:pe family protein [Trichinella spiralis]|uniref:pe family protein n=1 Tax=Trichinella spiralis TaxID=6334 RepID=UPI0001EFCEA0|nr:pe family protein [Trichinella spiralis]